MMRLQTVRVTLTVLMLLFAGLRLPAQPMPQFHFAAMLQGVAEPPVSPEAARALCTIEYGEWKIQPDLLRYDSSLARALDSTLEQEEGGSYNISKSQARMIKNAEALSSRSAEIDTMNDENKAKLAQQIIKQPGFGNAGSNQQESPKMMKYRGVFDSLRTDIMMRSAALRVSMDSLQRSHDESIRHLNETAQAAKEACAEDDGCKAAVGERLAKDRKDLESRSATDRRAVILQARSSLNGALQNLDGLEQTLEYGAKLHSDALRNMYRSLLNVGVSSIMTVSSNSLGAIRSDVRYQAQE